MQLPRLSKLPKLAGIRNSQAKAGLPPGTLIFVGDKVSDKSQVDLIAYNEHEIEEYSSQNTEQIIGRLDKTKVNWVNIDGLHNVDLIEQIGEHFHLHPLLLEDVLNTEHRPKSEDYADHLFFVLKTLYNLTGDSITYEQISFVLGKNYLLSFQEKEGDIFDGFRNRLRQINNNKNRARKKGSDYLFYRLIDTVVDGYYSILEKVGERIEILEDEVYDNPSRATLKKIQQLKKELVFLRKSVYPLREALSKVTKGEYSFIKKDTLPFFSDVYDHTIHVIETVETYRDLVTGVMDMYMTSVSNRMNEVMKVLTVIATIFIPLTFIVGVYGMNFEYIPELSWKYGYFGTWGVMLLICIGMLMYFKRKKWL
ncbi:Magnesium and cobalt transport protein CorA [Fulvivirga imtechensis AK7]|uniref:Magnesium transport protein CorA n=1 Tax=Fulvivirga imtechensis AK7 TaxID=1237149 RepID=L8JLH1_9BACT|nr:magnesium/cobalt transporter CorA [Fulvivirga imtechensis]ELR69665.1 Magnesium and cobalt transport protein CorA [Fulvivirga imtechensis AK7]